MYVGDDVRNDDIMIQIIMYILLDLLLCSVGGLGTILQLAWLVHNYVDNIHCNYNLIVKYNNYLYPL